MLKLTVRYGNLTLKSGPGHDLQTVTRVSCPDLHIMHLTIMEIYLFSVENTDTISTQKLDKQPRKFYNLIFHLKNGLSSALSILLEPEEISEWL